MLILIDIFSINRSRGYENPRLDIILIDIFSTGGFPLEEAREHCSQNQSVIYVFILIKFQCYCGDCSGFIVVILPFLTFYLCSVYFFISGILHEIPNFFYPSTMDLRLSLLSKFLSDWTVDGTSRFEPSIFHGSCLSPIIIEASNIFHILPSFDQLLTIE
jgi:hypothetical protein